MIYQPFSLITLCLKDDKGNNMEDLTDLIKNFEMEKYSYFLCRYGNSNLIEQSFLGRIPTILVFKFDKTVNGRHLNHISKYNEPPKLNDLE
jgi:hypothetical protein